MRINTHAHVFNLASVFTEQTLDILLNRIRDWDWPVWLAKAATEQLTKGITQAGPYADADTFVAGLLKKLAEGPKGQRVIQDLKDEGLEIEGVSGITKLAADGLLALARRLEDSLLEGDDDARKSSVVDAVEFLRIALQPSVRHVTRILMKDIAASDAIVALMMDITGEGSCPKLFETHMRDTSRMILAYPGRFFPFFAVNTLRADHFDLMDRALTSMGFAGVKLYPSLGYTIRSDAMEAVYAYCADRGIPALMHCNDGGFKLSDEWARQCNPELWRDILKDHPQLRICFAHFGGNGWMVEADLQPNAWTRTILELMDQYEGVYADVSYHTDEMAGGDAETNYFRNLKAWLDPRRISSKRILFGTDYFLVRRRLRERNYWTYFRKRLTSEEFDRISETNPRLFLGLDTPAGKPAPNMRNHLDFLAQHARAVEVLPAPWVTQAMKTQFSMPVVFEPLVGGSAWRASNRAHAIVFNYFNDKKEFYGQMTFEEAGQLLLSDLRYWIRQRMQAPTLATLEREKIASNLNIDFRSDGAQCQVPVDKARQQMADALRDGCKTLAEYAGLCDSLYLFKGEVSG